MDRAEPQWMFILSANCRIMSHVLLVGFMVSFDLDPVLEQELCHYISVFLAV